MKINLFNTSIKLLEMYLTYNIFPIFFQIPSVTPDASKDKNAIRTLTHVINTSYDYHLVSKHLL